ncbi:hypothetical protein SHAb15599_00101 [Acinetobacter phage SH-Ab 15599]|nr:hypothetical protein SHAb15599_00101 [Acinetobacter phage SH-Ab 15599]
MTTPFFPHLLVAVRVWCQENAVGCHIKAPTAQVSGLPQHIINRFPEEITLDISEGAVANFSIDIEQLHFNCRFNGVDCFVMTNVDKVILVHSTDGQIVCLNPAYVPDDNETEQVVKEEPKSQSKLRIVE